MKTKIGNKGRVQENTGISQKGKKGLSLTGKCRHKQNLKSDMKMAQTYNRACKKQNSCDVHCLSGEGNHMCKVGWSKTKPKIGWRKKTRGEIILSIWT